jgi:ABC-type multidrug transport system fused ATPase/permease subunit
VLAEITFGNILWAIVVIFFLTMYLMILFSVIGDLFRDHETSGFVKAVWIFCLLFFPFITLLIYVIARGPGMQKRALDQQKQQAAAFNDYVQSVAATGSPTEQIAKAKELLDAGTISQEEFDSLKAKALS